MGKSKKKFKIKENVKPKNEIEEKTQPEENGKEGIIVNFSCPFSFYCCKVGKEYTNYLKNIDSFIEKQKLIFGEVLEYFNKTTFEKLNFDKNGHTHKISNDKNKLVEKILTELVKIKWPDKDHEEIVGNYMTENIWQLGYPGGLRLIGSRKDNILNLLFIDYHHLLEPNKWHNEPDYFNNTYCPMTSI